MIKTAITTIPILSIDSNKPNTNPDVNVDLIGLLNDGYRVKIVNDFLYHDVIFAHYILEKEVEE